MAYHVQAGRRVGVDKGLPSRAARNLMDASIPVTPASADADVTVVNNAREFQAAVMADAQDIELRAHVDLTDLALAFNSNVSRAATVLGEIKPSTRSIRVRFASLVRHAVFHIACVDIVVAGFGAPGVKRSMCGLCPLGSLNAMPCPKCNGKRAHGHTQRSRTWRLAVAVITTIPVREVVPARWSGHNT